MSVNESYQNYLDATLISVPPNGRYCIKVTSEFLNDLSILNAGTTPRGCSRYRVQLASSLLAVTVSSTTDAVSLYEIYFCNYSTTPVQENHFD